MKSSVIAIIILALALSATLCSSAITGKTLMELRDDIESSFLKCGESCSEILAASTDMRKRFDGYITYLSFFINDEDMLEITQYYDDIKSAAAADSYDGALEAKNRLISQLEHLKRLSSFSIDAVF